MRNRGHLIQNLFHILTFNFPGAAGCNLFSSALEASNGEFKKWRAVLADSFQINDTLCDSRRRCNHASGSGNMHDHGTDRDFSGEGEVNRKPVDQNHLHEVDQVFYIDQQLFHMKQPQVFSVFVLEHQSNHMFDLRLKTISLSQNV